MENRTFRLLGGVIPLLVIIFISGCISGDNGGDPFASSKGVTRGPGVAITNFASDFSTVSSEELIYLGLAFENRGDIQAKNINATLIRKGAFNVTKEYTGSATTVNLDPPLEDINVFSSDEFTWKLTAPNITQERTEQIQARLYYDYQTIGYGTINFVPRQIVREKGPQSFPIASGSSNAPVRIDLVANQPVSIYGGDASKAVRVTVVLTNIGGGRVESNNGALSGCFNKKEDCIDSLEISGEGNTCKLKDGSTVYSLKSNGIKLTQGSEARKPYTFEFKIQDPNAATSCQLRVIAKYRYRVDTDAISIKTVPIDYY